MLYRKKKIFFFFGTIPKYFWGAGEQLYYFYGIGEREQNNFREQRKIFSGSLIFSGSKGVLISHGGLCEVIKHLDRNSLMIHNGIRNKMHMYKDYMSLKILTF